MEKGLCHTSIFLHSETVIAKKRFIQGLHCFAFPLLIRNKPFKLSSLGGDQRAQQAKLHEVTRASLVPVTAAGAASPDGALCLPAVGKEGKLRRVLKSEVVQH